MIAKIEEHENLKHYAIIIDGVVVNTVVWDGVSEYNPEGLLLDLTNFDPEPGIGWDWDGKKFADNRPQAELPA